MKKIVTLIILTITLIASPVYCLTIGGTQIENINSEIILLYTYENSTANILSGAQVSSVRAYDNSMINVEMGAQIAYIYGHDNSNLTVNGGDIAWLHTYGNNTTNLAFVEDLSWLLVNDDSIVNIYGSNFSYSSGHLSGIWGNGVPFSFWALEETALRTGWIYGALPDNIILRPIPEPSTVMLVSLGLLSIFAVNRKNRT